MKEVQLNTVPEKTFFQLQMESIGIDATNNSFQVPKFLGYTSFPGGVSTEFEGAQTLEAEEELETNLLFREDEAGNMVVPYYTLKGHVLTAHAGDNKWPKPFERIRLKIPVPGPDGKLIKYKTPWKAGNYIYFPPQIIQKFRKGEKIDTLIITEGEKKALRGCMIGLNVVGIAGIHNFYSNNNTKRLHEDLIWLMVVCKVGKLLFLTDADTLTVTFKPGKDLSKRPNLFYTAWKNFREAAMAEMSMRTDLELKDVYVGCIKREYKESGKGLDDLIQVNNPRREAAILESLRSMSFDNTFFNILNISDGLHKLQNFLGLISAENFYQVYAEDIKDNEFQYKKLSWRWLPEEEKLIRIGHQDVKEYMRIGCDYFRLVQKPTKDGQLEEQIMKWNKGEITQDYGKYFIEDLPKFVAWCNVPDTGPTYKRVHNGCFNLFNPITHTPAPGSIEKTAGFIKHLFEGEGTIEKDIEGDPFTVALDYLTIMWRHPMEILPVLCLVSPENGTGKSTFLKWLRDIYGGNATIIDNERFKQSFNGHYITKFVIGIDEGFLDVEKRAEKERLKKLATDDKQFLEFKGADVQEVDFYAKIIICSNDADSLMKIDEGEIRWFVIRVHSFASKNMEENPYLRDQMKAEIPAWLDFLSKRPIFHKKVGRAWFNPEHIVTEQLKAIIENTRNRVERVVDGVIQDMFHTYKVNSFRMDVVSILQIIKRDAESKYAIDQLEVKKFLKDKKKMLPSEPQRIRYPEGFNSETGEIVWNISKVGRCYTFQVEDWVKNADLGKYSEGGQRANMSEPVPALASIEGPTPKKPEGDDVPF